MEQVAELEVVKFKMLRLFLGVTGMDKIRKNTSERQRMYDVLERKPEKKY